MMINATLQEAKRERRRGGRHSLRLAAAVFEAREASQLAEIHDLSASGFLMRTAARPRPGEMIDLEIAEAIVEAKVVWGSGGSFGCEFSRPLTRAELSAALLKSDPTEIERATTVVHRLREISSHIDELTGDLDAVETELKTLGTAPDVLDAPVTDESHDVDGEEEEQRLPLAIRGWTILGLCLALWALIAWFTKAVW